MISRVSRSRFSSLPPYSSSRRFSRGFRNWAGRYPWLATTSTPSRPASCIRRAASPKPLTTSAIRAAGMGRGIVRNLSLTADDAE